MTHYVLFYTYMAPIQGYCGDGSGGSAGVPKRPVRETAPYAGDLDDLPYP